VCLNCVVKVRPLNPVAQGKSSEDLLNVPSRGGNILVQSTECHLCAVRLLQMSGRTLSMCNPNLL
jgi:hypothetical protein